MNITKQIKKSNQTNSQVILGTNLLSSSYLYNRSAFILLFSFVHQIGYTIYIGVHFIQGTGNKAIQMLWNIQQEAFKMKKVFCYVRGATIASNQMVLGGTRTTNTSNHMVLATIGSLLPKTIWFDQFGEQRSHQTMWFYPKSFNISLKPSGLISSASNERIKPHGLLRLRQDLTFS